MKRFIGIIALLAFAGVAQATNNTPLVDNSIKNTATATGGAGGAGGQGGAGGKGGEGGNATIIGSGNSSVKNDNTNVNINTLRSESEANAAAFAAQVQGQGQAQKATADNKGVTQGVTINQSTPRQAASASVGLAGITSSATCDRGFSAGVGVGGVSTPISVGFASYYEVKKCNKREEARMKFVAAERKFAAATVADSMNLKDNALKLFAQGNTLTDEGVALLDEAEQMTRDEEGKPKGQAATTEAAPTGFTPRVNASITESFNP